MPLFDKFDENRRAKFLGAIRKGLRIGQACRAAGISRDTMCDYCLANPEFRQAMNQAEADHCDQVEASLLELTKKDNLSAMIFWLTNRSPERWKDRRGQATTIVQNQGDPLLAEILKRLQEKKE